MKVLRVRQDSSVAAFTANERESTWATPPSPGFEPSAAGSSRSAGAAFFGSAGLKRRGSSERTLENDQQW